MARGKDDRGSRPETVKIILQLLSRSHNGRISLDQSLTHLGKLAGSILLAHHNGKKIDDMWSLMEQQADRTPGP